MLAWFYGASWSVLYWLTALRLLPHEIYPRSIQCHFVRTPEYDVVIRVTNPGLTFPGLALTLTAVKHPIA
jgi:hypothetical protein